ncbi:FadR/GntR family transcriptional regulator [Rhodococcus sp. UNC23MFCrub1.1]|uniref:FadR/GntR family transcriptional regulator n=1 Tax=Rhodococcus sp. UNC23MFCrub1.1 TaxID=1449068 RepID=UPI0004812776|nr:FadR/GntR family transcriptional regulator [Rhodococcus sp. UNC23MFCrub1.1]
MTTESAQPARVYQLIADKIENAVLSGELKPGDRLPSERELVQQYGVSRPTVREALRVLESNHLVKSRLGDRRGPVVLPLTSHSLRKALTRLTSVNAVGLQALLQFRMIIDSAAVVLAAQYRTDSDLLEMERANARMRASVELGYEEFSQADFDFHRIVARSSKNPLLELSGEAVRGSVLGLIEQRIVDSGDSYALMQSSIRHHTEVLDAVRAGDGGHAAWLTRDGLYWYYFDYLDPADRPGLRALADEVRPL